MTRRPLLIVRRLRVRGFDPFQFDGLERGGEPLLLCLQPRKLPGLVRHHLVQLIHQMFQVGQV